MAYGKRLNIYTGNRKPKIMLSCSVFPVNLSFLLANTVFCSNNKYSCVSSVRWFDVIY